MSVLELFNIYHPTAYCHGMVAFHVRQNPIFIWLRGNYSNNEYWSKGFLYISGEWESSTTETLAVDQRILQEWRHLEYDYKYSTCSLLLC
jgi:hypothetical protein